MRAEVREAERFAEYDEGFFGGRYGDGYAGLSLVRAGVVEPRAEQRFPATLAALRGVARRVERDDRDDDGRLDDDATEDLGATVGSTRLAFFARRQRLNSQYIE